MKIRKGQRTVKRPKTYRRDLGILKERFTNHLPGKVHRLILYPDGEAFIEGLDGAVPVAPDDPMHPENPAGELETYLG